MGRGRLCLLALVAALAACVTVPERADARAESRMRVAIADVGNAVLTELIAVPDSPNLYWALTELPSPMFDMRESLRFEMAIGHRIFPFLGEAESAQYAPDEWARLWAEAWSDLQTLSTGDIGWSEVASLGMSLLHYGHAKQRLIDWGFGEQQVEQMPVGQVLASPLGFRPAARAVASTAFGPASTPPLAMRVK
jgi:hypothetical protein